jgi:YesN/AraC family two-component response regulator
MTVQAELEKLGISYSAIELGEVSLTAPIADTLRNTLKDELHKWGLELMYDRKAMLVEKIVNIIVEMVHYSDELPNVNFSTYLAEKMHQDYHKMAEIFSKTKGITIEHFIIVHKIEKIKELIIYDDLNLTEISYQMHYASVAHLSKQFKQVTGMTPTVFKSQSKRVRTNLEDL